MLVEHKVTAAMMCIAIVEGQTTSSSMRNWIYERLYDQGVSYFEQWQRDANNCTHALLQENLVREIITLKVKNASKHQLMIDVFFKRMATGGLGGGRTFVNTGADDQGADDHSDQPDKHKKP